MFKRWHRHNYNFFQLMLNYAGLITIVVLLFTIYLATTSVWTNTQEINSGLVSAVDKTTNQITANRREIQEIGQSLTNSPRQISNLHDYFELSPAQYLAKSQNKVAGDIFYYLPGQASQIISQDEGIREMTISMTNYRDIFTATRANPMGQKVTKKLDLNNRFAFSYTFVNTANLENYGTLYLTFSTTSLSNTINKVNLANDLQLVVLGDGMTPIYQYHGSGVSVARQRETLHQVHQISNQERPDFQQLRQQYRVRTADLPNGYTVIALSSKHAAFKSNLWRILSYFGEALLIDGLLLAGLWFTFRNYRRYLILMIASMKQVEQGNLDVRLQVPEQPGDLQTMASGINRMLDAINQYIYQIYHLKIEQQDANMKALQSQIRPHFLYNTLEYIRMYAVAEDEPELAEVVYTFAALLRNNTDQSKTTTLAKELDFTEKYIYLYQMRFPDKIAYEIDVGPELKQVIVPKFTLQPLVENYFAHGIDYSRDDNAISIKIFKQAGYLVISVIDNGQGMSTEQLQAVQQQINGDVKATDRHDTIGLRNVLERLQGFFDQTASLTVRVNELHGVTVQIQIKWGELDATGHAS